jgi:hypothetical protein
MNREQNREENKRLKILIEQDENIITKRKTGTKVKKRIEQFRGA